MCILYIYIWFIIIWLIDRYRYIYICIYLCVCVSTCIYHPLFRSILFRSHTPYWFLRGLALCRQVDVPSFNWSPEIPGAKHRKMLKEFDKRNVTRAAQDVWQPPLVLFYLFSSPLAERLGPPGRSQARVLGLMFEEDQGCTFDRFWQASLWDNLCAQSLLRPV